MTSTWLCPDEIDAILAMDDAFLGAAQREQERKTSKAEEGAI